MAVSTAVDASAVARVVGIKTNFKNLRGGNVALLPQRIAVIGLGSTTSTYPSTKLQVTSAKQAGDTYGFGSPIHLAVKALLPSNGDGVGTIPVTVYPLQQDGSGVAAIGSITPVGVVTKSEQYTVVINNISSRPFVVTPTDTVATIVTSMTDAINAVLDMPMTASDNVTDVQLTAKWTGTSSNQLSVEMAGPDVGVTYVVVQPVGGLVNPDIQPALDDFGNVWESLVLNLFEYTDSTILSALDTAGIGRWGSLVKMPFIAFTGSTEADVATVATIPEANKEDYTNAYLLSPASKDLPFIVAARELTRIAVQANNNPPVDYGSQAIPGLVPGPDGQRWDYPTRDEAVKKGVSTIEVRDNVVHLSDTITFYHPEGEVPPAYRYVVDIIKLQNILYNTNLIFQTPSWDGAPLVPDDQAVDNPAARKPKTAVAAIAAMIDELALAGIIVNPDAAKKTIVAEIDSENPKRLNARYTVQIVGNANIISIDFDFGFNFG
jgi:phage tail sheath gpL-like